MSYTAFVYSSNTVTSRTAVLVCSDACSAVKAHVQYDVCCICVAVVGMVFEAKNELKQYLSSINPLYAKYTECLWAKEVNSTAQLGYASVPVMHACGVENPFHAGDIIAQSKALGKWSSAPSDHHVTHAHAACPKLVYSHISYSETQ